MMQTVDPNIPFDEFAIEDLWALSSLRAFLFDEYRITQDIDKLPKVTVSLLLQFDRHMAAAESTGKITIVTHTSNAFAGIEEPLFHSKDLDDRYIYDLIGYGKVSSWFLDGLTDNLKFFLGGPAPNSTTPLFSASKSRSRPTVCESCGFVR